MKKELNNNARAIRKYQALYLEVNLLDMKFSDYKLKDFLQDESFKNWVNKTVLDDMAQWELWLENNPHKRLMAYEAAAIIRGITFKKNQVSRQIIDTGWHELTGNIATEKMIAYFEAQNIALHLDKAIFDEALQYANQVFL